MFECFEIENEDDLLQYQADWSRLLSKTPHASFFQSNHWLSVRWKHATAEEEHFVIGVRDGENVVGFLPIVIAPIKTTLGQMKVAKFPLDGWGSVYGPISEQPVQTLDAALSHLVASKRNFDFVELSSIPDPDNPVRGVDIEEDLTSLSLLGQPCQEGGRIGQIDLTEDWETYWESRRKQKNRRRNVERCERRLSELGTIRWERFRPSSAGTENETDFRWDLLESCENISRISWQKDLVNGNTLHHEVVNPMLRDAYAAAVRAGAADLSLLYLDDRPIAYAYGYHYQGYVDLYRIGFDPEFAKVAPGNALWSRLLRDSFDRGDRVVDLGPTCLDYKRFWITRLEPTYTYCRYLSIRSQALRAARQVKSLRTTGAPVVDSNQGNRQLAAESGT